MAWLRSATLGEALFPQCAEPVELYSADEVVFTGIVQILMPVEGRPWEDVAKVLDGLYHMLRATDTAWIKDEDKLILWG